MKEASRHLAVIMARGSSTRMGMPKGLCRLQGQDDVLAVQVARLYSGIGMDVLLIVRKQDAAVYRELMVGQSVHILEAPGGGDTALTMKIALRWAALNDQHPEYFWAHPVDLPLVRPQTIVQLLEASATDSHSAWRPYYGDKPGHPVLLPAHLLKLAVVADPLDKSMSSVWKEAIAQGITGPIRKVSAEDPGTVTDFDTPEQLNFFTEPKEPES